MKVRFAKRSPAAAFAFLVLGLMCFPSLFTPTSAAQGDGKSQDALWEDVDERVIPPQKGDDADKLTSFRAARLDLEGLRRKVSPDARAKGAMEVELPVPDPSSNKYIRFRVEESSVMSPELAAKLPDLKTYRGRGIDDPSATTRFSVSAAGLSAIVITQDGTFYIDPFKGDPNKSKPIHLSYGKEQMVRPEKKIDTRDTRPQPPPSPKGAARRGVGLDGVPASARPGRVARTYRLAVAATAEYTAAVADADPANGGPADDALRAIVNTINRVQEVYERELAIRFQLVDKQSDLIFTDTTTDGYPDSFGANTDAQAVLRNHEVLESVVGGANYDIGHVFGVGGGGWGPGRICNSTFDRTNFSTKGMGLTGRDDPSGDGFDIDYVAHELGHQMGAWHTWTSCEYVRTGFEPGSGSTIMSYAGICSDPALNVQPNSHDYFHSQTLIEIAENVTGSGTGRCGVASETNNQLPSVQAGPDRLIPRGTPFALVATGTDPDGDALLYSWEQYDRYGPKVSDPDSDAVDVQQVDANTEPLFRSFRPTLSPVRAFPSLELLLTRPSGPVFERLPSAARTMTFVATARDGFGGFAMDDMRVTVVGTSGPFAVSRPAAAATLRRGARSNVVWSVARTNVAPIRCARVKISLSTDGGRTFPHVLAASTPNDGAQMLVIPAAAQATTTAVVKVEAVGNIFFALSPVFRIG
ncbi:MAG TPA: M12 family metallo-peptidase [Pyrinomonadaceae bacterium]|nr:M12 family metallo-peptidase [Pyrinomonadaceae bacterium]